ncbi:MAG TPA: GNAT family N-acetyltransferase [Nocardioidaceae bacterium]|nr:GNAT family N-acetyltransferase [Nocardioidaceae bacterium]
MADRLHVNIIDNPEHHRVEARTEDGQLAGFSQYYVRDGAYVFFHTEVDDAFEGQGIASQIAHGVIEFVQHRRMPIVAECEFIRGWMRKHPDTHKCLASSFSWDAYNDGPM